MLSAGKRLRSPRVLTVPDRPFRLATAERTPEARQTLEELARQNAEYRVHERDAKAARRKAAEHQVLMEQSRMVHDHPRQQGVTATEPFELSSSGRHEVFQQELLYRTQRDKAEMKKLSDFHARPVPQGVRLPLSAVVRSPRSNRPLTEMEPFRLQSLQRHEQSRLEFEASLEQMEVERRRMAEYRAAPVPISTRKQPKSPKREPHKPVVASDGPSLRTIAQARRREIAERERRRRREREEEAKCELEQRRLEEEERDLRDRRNRPVSEGGYLHVAKPIGSVFTFRGAEDDRDVATSNEAVHGDPALLELN